MWHEWGKRGMNILYWWESQKEIDNIILGWILERYDGMVWIGLIGTDGGLL
jgi:hypothetical protein